ncbi:T9SS type A sorting domain-containing protein [Hymenobacter weizhouensis]|uniref:T9SS type A sorting domain-containing protein n=1 Tax=Hymenobacter sp. YIM 151500-1 TaxID=2987689 RepID=UPI002227B03D|nr:T9SS type A sorting domain-containing protein [Hymenobacter sp. YIM 151500-1]UYZ63353.1 T9SS type A sorting domain-containing protein [Hymenobacter sp. YIM 151500-1]
MLKNLLLYALTYGLLLISSKTAIAQPTWQRLYGGGGRETCSQLVHLKGGGYLLIGSRAAQNEKYEELYLVRTDEQGNQLWTRNHSIPDSDQIFPTAASENGAGQVLVSATITLGSTTSGTQTSTGLLLLLQPDGSVAWSKRTPASGRLTPGYVGGALDDAGNFWVGINEASGAALLRLDATGREMQRVAVPNGPVYKLFRLPSGLYAHTSGRLISVSDQGVLGSETTLPVNVYVNQTNSYVTDVVPLAGDDVLIVSDGQLDKIKLSSSTVYWTRARSQGNLLLNPSWGARLPNGNLLVYGIESVSSHTFRPTIAHLDAEGNQLYTPPAGPGGGPVPVRHIIGSSISAAAAGLFVNAATGQVVAGGFLRDMDANAAEVFLNAYSFAGLGIVTSTARVKAEPLKAWPNPLSDKDILTVPALPSPLHQVTLYTLQGHLLRRWSELKGNRDIRLSLQGIPAGMYVLIGQQANGKQSALRILKN